MSDKTSSKQGSEKHISVSVVGNGATVDGSKFKHNTIIGEQHITQVYHDAGTPITPLADTQRSHFNARSATVDGDVRLVDMGQAPVAMNTSHAQAGSITMIHAPAATPEQLQAVAGLFPPPRK